MKSQKAKKSKSSRPGLPFSLSSPADLQSKVQKLQLAIAGRAHDLFEARGREHGHDLEDWLRAESELLCPVSIAMSESKDRVGVRANVAGFDQSEIEVSVEPGRVIILGKRHKVQGREPGTTEPRGSHPDQILEVIDLATEVLPEHVVVERKEGELILELPAASKNKTGSLRQSLTYTSTSKEDQTIHPSFSHGRGVLGNATSIISPQAHGSKDSQESELAMVGRGSNSQGRYCERPYVQFVGGRRRPGHRRIRGDAGGDLCGSRWNTEIDRLKYE